MIELAIGGLAFICIVLAIVISVEEDIVERKYGTGKDVVNRAKDFGGDI